ncbi:beta-carotene 15,15'-monooxygenase [Sporosarcina sp. ANT_H38]|uniref:beta-carotene 15,15'-monooxygenase n=1 Tax=Sporosarcina sp. ANT_H38 TaxID=2597358 RepID=UPI0011F13D76|nr:beta-carotene 15,15'-monooxygenase [Sporosarcina sp. ANT_H38]KAA0955707.1 beta-carotene 15,15'-monooxygenase [Sporosarcina sp. ANT_H38]
MVSSKRNSKTPLLLVALVLVISSNLALYRLPFPFLPAPADATWVIFGSLFDFSIIAPLLIVAMTRKKGFTVKRFVTFMVLGIITARIIIPNAYFEPFKFIPYIALTIEGIILLTEIGLIIILLKHVPRIIQEVKESGEGPFFTYAALVEKRIGKHPLIKIISAESVMFYYAFASWRKQPIMGENRFSLHTKTSFIAFYIMLIHAIVIETIGIHWWLFDKSIILSIVLLIVNIYSVIFFLGYIQAVRLNPLSVDGKQIHVALGLGKRMVIPFDEIEHIAWGTDAANENLKAKDTIDFTAMCHHI